MPHAKTCPVCGKSFTTRHKHQCYCSHQCHGQTQIDRIERVCPICHVKFSGTPATIGQYCSLACAGKSNGQKKSRKISHICITCGKTFLRSPSATGSYCSVDCQRKPVDLNCETCGKVFTRTPATIGRYCSFECRTLRSECICAHCEKTFHTRPSETRKYCSQECYHKSTNPTGIETKTAEALVELGIDFVQEQVIWVYHVDFYLSMLNICLEVDGDYWHSVQKNKGRDRRKDKYLTSKGYRVIRISESEINSAECVTTLVAQCLGLMD